MKRHASLIPLSHEHHGALILARLLQKDAPPYKGLPADPEGKAEFALRFYDNDLLKHFESEEKMIPLVRNIDQNLDNLLDSMIREHEVLHQLFKITNDQIDLSYHLDILGKTLENHIRKEERQIFPLIQEKCSAEILEKIQVLLLQ